MFKANHPSRFRMPAARAILALGAIAALGALDAAHVATAQGAWCADYSGRGGSNCGFYTLEQCRATVSGVGGTCSPSPYVTRSDVPLRRKVRRRD
jgi:hypothetical protein